MLEKFICVVLLLLILFGINDSKAQSVDLNHKAPTLQIGLDQLSLTKGALDYEVIANMIAEKQNEIKLKFVQNLFLTRVENAGGHSYSYVENILNSILTEKNPELRARQVLEQTVNMVFVSVFAKHYIQQRSNAQNVTNLQTLAYYYHDRQAYHRENFLNKNLKAHIKQSISDTSRTSDGRPKIGSKSNEFMAILLDMISEVVRKDENLKRLGLMQISRSATYEYKNLYLKVLNRKIKPPTLSVEHLQYLIDTIASLRSKNDFTELAKLGPVVGATDALEFSRAKELQKYKASIGDKKDAATINKEEDLKKLESFNREHNYLTDLRELHNELSKQLLKVTDHIGLVNYLISQSSFRNSDIHVLDKKENSENDSPTDYSSLIEKLVKANLYLDSGIIAISANTSLEDSLRKHQVSSLVKIKRYNLKAIGFLNNSKAAFSVSNAPVLSDILYSISKEFTPALEELTYNYPNLIKAGANLGAVSESLAFGLMNATGLDSLTNDQVKPFFLLASKLYEFDRAKTISDYLSYSNDLISLFPDDKISSVFSHVNTFVKDYTVLKVNENGKEVVEFNVQEFLVKLQGIRKERYNPFKFHFTVGLNSGYFKTPLYLKSDTLTSFSTVSEKIGLKIKLRDFKFIRLRDPGETYNYFWRNYIRASAPKDPLISDIHLLLYGSGILYGILNTSTNKTFDSPIAGAGLGVTFSNALDLNFSVAIPVLNDRSFKNSMKNPLFTLGFDVLIGEYLSKLANKKNRHR